MLKIILKKRVGRSPSDLGVTDNTENCPDIWETENGDFVVIGKDVTHLVDISVTDAIISNGEKIVLIPRITLLSAIDTFNEG